MPTPSPEYELGLQFKEWSTFCARARALLGSQESAEDCVQEAFLAVLKYCRSHPPLRNPRAFIWTTVIRRANRMRKDRVKNPLAQAKPLEESPDISSEPLEQAIQNEDAGRVQAALDRLDPRDREVLNLRYLQGLGNKEAAEKLGLSNTAAHNRMTRALSRLRGFLGENLPGGEY